MLKSKCCISNYPRYIDFCHLKNRDNFGDVFFLRGWEGFQFFTLTMTIHGACSQGRVGLSKRVKLSESI